MEFNMKFIIKSPIIMATIAIFAQGLMAFQPPVEETEAALPTFIQSKPDVEASVLRDQYDKGYFDGVFKTTQKYQQTSKQAKTESFKEGYQLGKREAFQSMPAPVSQQLDIAHVTSDLEKQYTQDLHDKDDKIEELEATIESLQRQLSLCEKQLHESLELD
jgi:hypothetical protein